MTFSEQLAACRVLPVVTAHDVDSTVAVAGALARGGMRAIEITLRTEAALEAISAVRESCPDLWVAAGTVVRPEQVEQALTAGAQACISPGISESLLDCTRNAGVDFLPGAATASEVMLGLVRGIDCFKLFPAVTVGGIPLLKSLAGPFPGVNFCPTGGLNVKNFREFLAQPNVLCCGGSWMVAEDLVAGGRWDDIEQLSREAMAVE